MDPRGFLESYQVTEDPLPIKVLRNTIIKEEIPGQAIHWAFEYLDQRSCPLSLINHICEKLYHEVKEADFTHCAESSEDSVDHGIVMETRYEPLKLMRAVVKILDDICIKEKEDYQDSVDGMVERPDMQPHVFAVSYNNIKNSRRFMEDRMTVLPRMDRIFNLPTPISYFAVFDGHNGSEAAAYGAAQLHQCLIQSMSQCTDVIASITDAFQRLDNAFVQKCVSGKIKSGSTAVMSLLMPNELYVAWVGDSQAILVKRNETNNLVIPHKPERLDELDRIRSSGGEVFQMNGTYRVNGNLAVSRAIGDADDKSLIISEPDIKMLNLDGTEEFLILACDGLWDEISLDAAAHIVRHQIVNDTSNVSAISNKLIQQAKSCGSTDNISVIVVFFEAIESIKNRYEGVIGTELDLSVFKKASEPVIDGNLDLVTEMNGHRKDSDQLVDFLSFGSSKESGAQLIGDDGNHSGDDIIIKKEVEEVLSDAESDDEWQFEKPNQDLNSTHVITNNTFVDNPFNVETGELVDMGSEPVACVEQTFTVSNDQLPDNSAESFNPFYTTGEVAEDNVFAYNADTVEENVDKSTDRTAQNVADYFNPFSGEERVVQGTLWAFPEKEDAGQSGNDTLQDIGNQSPDVGLVTSEELLNSTTNLLDGNLNVVSSEIDTTKINCEEVVATTNGRRTPLDLESPNEPPPLTEIVNIVKEDETENTTVSEPVIEQVKDVADNPFNIETEEATVTGTEQHGIIEPTIDLVNGQQAENEKAEEHFEIQVTPVIDEIVNTAVNLLGENLNVVSSEIDAMKIECEEVVATTNGRITTPDFESPIEPPISETVNVVNIVKEDETESTSISEPVIDQVKDVADNPFNIETEEAAVTGTEQHEIIEPTIDLVNGQLSENEKAEENSKPQLTSVSEELISSTTNLLDGNLNVVSSEIDTTKIDCEVVVAPTNGRITPLDLESPNEPPPLTEVVNLVKVSENETELRSSTSVIDQVKNVADNPFNIETDEAAVARMEENVIVEQKIELVNGQRSENEKAEEDHQVAPVCEELINTTNNLDGNLNVVSPEIVTTAKSKAPAPKTKKAPVSTKPEVPASKTKKVPVTTSPVAKKPAPMKPAVAPPPKAPTATKVAATKSTTGVASGLTKATSATSRTAGSVPSKAPLARPRPAPATTTAAAPRATRPVTATATDLKKTTPGTGTATGLKTSRPATATATGLKKTTPATTTAAGLKKTTPTGTTATGTGPRKTTLASATATSPKKTTPATTSVTGPPKPRPRAVGPTAAKPAATTTKSTVNRPAAVPTSARSATAPKTTTVTRTDTRTDTRTAARTISSRVTRTIESKVNGAPPKGNDNSNE